MAQVRHTDVPSHSTQEPRGPVANTAQNYLFSFPRLSGDVNSIGSPDSPQDLMNYRAYKSHSPPPVLDSSQADAHTAPRSLSHNSTYSKILSSADGSDSATKTSIARSDSSLESAQLPSGFAVYPDHAGDRCYTIRITTWFYFSLGSLLCFVTLRTINNILSKTSCPKPSEYVLWYTLIFDAAQILMIILAAVATYKSNSRLISLYLLFQIAGLALNGFLVVQFFLSPPSSPPTTSEEQPAGSEPPCNIQNSSWLIDETKSTWPELALAGFNTLFCVATIVFGTLCTRLAYLQSNCHRKRVHNTPQRQNGTGGVAAGRRGVASAPLLDASVNEPSYLHEPSGNSLHGS